MTINGVSTCANRCGSPERFFRGYRKTQRHLCSTTTATPINKNVLLCQTHVGECRARTGQVAERKEGKGGQTMNTTYQTLIVKLSEPITALDAVLF